MPDDKKQKTIKRDLYWKRPKGQPFWGPNWFFLPLLIAGVLLFTWISEMNQNDEGPRVIDAGNGITIRPIED